MPPSFARTGLHATLLLPFGKTGQAYKRMINNRERDSEARERDRNNND